MSIPTLPPTVPHLEEDGRNWAAFATRFQEATSVTHRWAYIVGATARPIPKDAANPTNAEREAIKAWEREDAVAGYLLSTRLPDWLALGLDDYPTAKTQWDAIIEEFGHPGNPNINTPEGVAHPEPDSTHGEDANPNTDARAHLEGAGSQVLMDEEDDCSLKVEEEGTARENASVEGDMGPRVELQDPGVSPLATHEDAGSSPSPSPSSTPTPVPEAASTERSPAANTEDVAHAHLDRAEPDPLMD